MTSRSELLQRELGWSRGSPVPVSLGLSPAGRERPELLVAFATAAQLLARMPGAVARLGLSADQRPTEHLTRLLGFGSRLDEVLRSFLEKVELVPITVDPLDAAFRIVVGALPGDDADISIDAEAGRALVGIPGNAGASGVAAVIAACLGVNELFQIVHAGRSHARRYAFAVSPSSTPTSLVGTPEIHLAGAGAVAQSFLWTVAALGLTSKVFAADGDIVDATNLERLPFARAHHIGQTKISVMREALTDSSVDLAGVETSYEVDHPAADVPLLLAIDDDVSRATLQQLGAPLTISATTGGLAATVEWSDLDPAYACTSCWHQPRGRSPADLARALGIPLEEMRGTFTTARVQMLERAHDLPHGSLAHLVGRDVCGELDELARAALGIGAPTGSVGFLSWFAGALLLAELLNVNGTQRPRRHMHPLMRPDWVSAKDPRPTPACSCQSSFFKAFYASRRAAFHAAPPGESVPSGRNATTADA